MTEGKNWEIRIFLVLVKMSVYALGKSNHALCSTHIYEIHMVSIHVRATDSYRCWAGQLKYHNIKNSSKCAWNVYTPTSFMVGNPVEATAQYTTQYTTLVYQLEQKEGR